MHSIYLPAACLLAFLAQTCFCIMGNFTIFENFNNHVLSISPIDGLLEIKPNATDRWFIESFGWSREYVVIRHRDSNRFISFPRVAENATAELSKNAATVLVISDPHPYDALRYRISANQLYFTVEANSNTDPRRVLRLRSRVMDYTSLFALLPEPLSLLRS
ncbi:hypothetical protein MGYG_08219 [Nannizzia gypsea CBS 118893]|uniref:Uncharacterized protein n=1 Tax=Arthroderma gypseum (strain ATCC MYA-4604 / CBS 118893) TaxID=535722 RepID=E4V5D1_ARTGP|nr:hypothetical protein MGYG_08219 [Nannizzia gypsea CBS 118893]EFR05205.1 hypothetical protein MGYG_08219 [Nannizzia gypsea CBS 118893]